MSTYFYIVCEKCEIQIPLTAVWAGGPGFLNGHEQLPTFVFWHLHDYEDTSNLKIVSEHSEKHEDYYCPFLEDGFDKLDWKEKNKKYEPDEIE